VTTHQTAQSPVKALVEKALEALEEIVPGLSDAGKIIVDMAFNSESTDGLKQHSLREEDAGKGTQIVINPDNTVEWVSQSGTSETASGVYGEIGTADFTGACGEGRAVRFNSDKPSIRKINWSNYSIL